MIKTEIYTAAQSFITNDPTCSINSKEFMTLVQMAAADNNVGNDSAEFLKLGLAYFDAMDATAQKMFKDYGKKLGVVVTGETVRTSVMQQLNDVRAGNKVLSRKLKASDEDVYIVQRALIALARLEKNPDFMLKGFGADGEYGPETERAVKAFQKSRGLSADGDVGKFTMKQIDSALDAFYKNQQAPANTTYLKPWELMAKK